MKHNRQMQSTRKVQSQIACIVRRSGTPRCGQQMHLRLPKVRKPAQCHTEFNKLNSQSPLARSTLSVLRQTSPPSPACLKRSRRASRLYQSSPRTRDFTTPSLSLPPRNARICVADRFEGVEAAGQPPRLLSVTLWNVANINAVRRGGAKPALQEVGPFTFQRHQRKQVRWHDPACPLGCWPCSAATRCLRCGRRTCTPHGLKQAVV